MNAKQRRTIQRRINRTLSFGTPVLCRLPHYSAKPVHGVVAESRYPSLNTVRVQFPREVHLSSRYMALREVIPAKV